VRRLQSCCPGFFLLIVSGCALVPGQRPPRIVYSPSAQCGPCRGIVFCVPGAGDFPQVCETIREAAAEQHVPLRVETVDWSHGYGRVLADHLDTANHDCQAQRLAEEIITVRHTSPSQRIYLLAHSAGCIVALEAAERVPPGTIDSIILLAPSVSAQYDLRRALLATTGTIEVFYSERDWAALGIGTALVGTTDRTWTAAAGRVGFEPVTRCPGDEALYTRLRQHPWDRCLSWTGNRGGHYGAYSPVFFRVYIMPLLREG
jgi:pimeloyl-ACP methyl ester carboxylesterase